MKLNNQKREVIKNTESSELRIDNSEEGKSLQFQLVMEKLYSDPLQATLREIISNALDANKEVGNKKIKITLPTINDDSCWIRDYGPGISPTNMEEVYMTVFSSTKREDNENIGCYGIGRLSCLSLAQQYPLVTYYEGKEYHYAIYMNSKGVPECSLLSVYDSEEPPGTAVGIPLSKENQQRTSDTYNWDINLLESKNIPDYYVFIINMLAFSNVELDCPTLEPLWKTVKHHTNNYYSTDSFVLSFTKLNQISRLKTGYYGQEQGINTVLTIGGIPYAIPRSFLGNHNDCYGNATDDLFSYEFLPSTYKSKDKDGDLDFLTTSVDKKTRLFMRGVSGPYKDYFFINLSSTQTNLNLTTCPLELRIPIGEVDLSSSRESILETEKNKKIIYRYLFQASKEIADYYQKLWKDCNSFDSLAKLAEEHICLSALVELNNVSPNTEEYKSIDGINILHTPAQSLGQFILYNPYFINIKAFLGGRYSRGLPVKIKIPYDRSKNFLPNTKSGNLGSFIAESKYNGCANVISFNLIKKIKFVFHYSESFSAPSVYNKRLPYDFEQNVSVVTLIKEGCSVLEKWNILKDNGFDVYFLSKQTKTKRKQPAKDVGRFIRPLNQEAVELGKDSWKELFCKEPVNYEPTGYYVTTEYNIDSVANTLKLFSKEELSKVYYVSIGASKELDPTKLRPLDELITNRRESRSNIENSLLYVFTPKYYPESVKSFFMGMSNFLTPEAKKFFENYEEHVRQHKQEKQYNDRWKFNVLKYKYDIQDKEVCEYLFGTNYDKYQALIARLIEYNNRIVDEDLETLKELYVGFNS